LGIESQYRFYHKKNMGGVYGPGANEALTTTIGLRYKFAANGEKQHARNISVCEYYPKPVPVVIEKETKDNSAEILERLNAVEQENAALKQKLQKLDDDMKALSTQDKGVVNATFQNIEFEFGSDQLTEDSYSTLDQIAVILINNPTWARLNVAGHTDSIGTSEYNQTLSEARANAVKNYLLNKNVPETSVIVTGYGEDKPIATNDTDEGRQKNRRVEFQITK
jgi:OOP family OmpA-OmpF porin